MYYQLVILINGYAYVRKSILLKFLKCVEVECQKDCNRHVKDINLINE